MALMAFLVQSVFANFKGEWMIYLILFIVSGNIKFSEYTVFIPLAL